MAIFAPFGFLKQEAGGGPLPPVEADAFDFLANNYTGTGDWFDQTGNYSAAAHNSPIYDGAAGAKYFTLDGNDGFIIPQAQNPGAIWSSQNGTAGTAIGSLEVFIKPNSYTGRLINAWSGTSSRRSFIFGFDPTSKVTTYFQTVNNTYRTFRNTSIAMTTGVWNHLVIRWSMASNLIQITLNDSVNGFATFVLTNQVWQGSADTCFTLGFLQDDCSNSREYVNGDVACFRGFNTFLSNEEVTELYNYWTGLGY